MLNGLARAFATLLGAAGAGVLLWLAAQVGRNGTGGYWAAYGIIAVAGLVFALSQLRGGNGQPRGVFLFGFVPVLVVAGWVLLGLQPHSNWFRSHVLNWSGDMHVRGAVQDVGTWLGVLAFGVGYTFAAMLEPTPRKRTAIVEPVVPAHEPVVTPEPALADDTEVNQPDVSQPDVSQPVGEAVPVP